MAVLKFGSIVTEGSGSLQGHTIQHSKGGMQLRSKPIPHGNPSASQTLIRSINKQLQAGWRALTSSQQKIWNDWPVTHGIFNAKGDKHALSGHSLWMKLQYYQLFNGLPLFSNPAYAKQGAELITSWTNVIAYPYETFVSVLKNINSAINSVTTGHAYNTPQIISKKDAQFYFSGNFHLISGQLPVFFMRYSNVSIPYSNPITPSEGVFAGIITISLNSPYYYFQARNTLSCNWSLSNPSLKPILY